MLPSIRHSIFNEFSFESWNCSIFLQLSGLFKNGLFHYCDFNQITGFDQKKKWILSNGTKKKLENQFPIFKVTSPFVVIPINSAYVWIGKFVINLKMGWKVIVYGVGLPTLLYHPTYGLYSERANSTQPEIDYICFYSVAFPIEFAIVICNVTVWLVPTSTSFHH